MGQINVSDFLNWLHKVITGAKKNILRRMYLNLHLETATTIRKKAEAIKVLLKSDAGAIEIIIEKQQHKSSYKILCIKIKPLN
jgi:hypothetical protein